MASNSPEEAPIHNHLWCGETWMEKRRERVSMMVIHKKKQEDVVIDYSSTHFKRLSEVIENTKAQAIEVLKQDWKSKAIYFNSIIWIESVDCRWELRDHNLRIIDKPVRIEVRLSNWLVFRGTIYLKLSNNVIQRTANSKFLNVFNVVEHWRWQMEWGEEVLRMKPNNPATLLCNVSHIADIEEIERLFKVIRTPSQEAGKKDNEKIVPLDYIEELPEQSKAFPLFPESHAL